MKHKWRYMNSQRRKGSWLKHGRVNETEKYPKHLRAGHTNMIDANLWLEHTPRIGFRYVKDLRFFPHHVILKSCKAG